MDLWKNLNMDLDEYAKKEGWYGPKHIKEDAKEGSEGWKTK